VEQTAAANVSISFGCSQFHPEKSGDTGLAILKATLSPKPKP
jgi:imidazoleglycerol phosphate synthase glutamine amidotransferase subunit HisH